MNTSSEWAARMDHLLAAAKSLEKQGRGAEALELLRRGEDMHGWDTAYLVDILRLVCLFGSREEARRRLEELRKRDDFPELWMQADEDFLPVWNSRPESIEWRRGFGLA